MPVLDEGGLTRLQLYLFWGLLFALAVAVFAVQNVTPVNIRFLVWQAEVSLSLVLLGSMFAGTLAALVLGLPRRYRTARRIRELTARLAEYELRPKPEAPRSGAEAESVCGGNGGRQPGTDPGGGIPGDREPERQ